MTNKTETIDDLERSAARGDARAMFCVGQHYDVPARSTVQPNLEVARIWYERAAKLGHGEAQFALANMLDCGDGGPQDLKRARALYSEAAKKNVSGAPMHYARMLETGRGGDISTENAAKWYEKALSHGEVRAFTNLGAMHFRKELAESSDNEAFRLFNLAAMKMDGLAHLYVGEMYLRGRGTPLDSQMALFHFCIAELLLSNGTNKTTATNRKESMLQQWPSQRSAFESRALACIRDLGGTIPT